MPDEPVDENLLRFLRTAVRRAKVPESEKPWRLVHVLGMETRVLTRNSQVCRLDKWHGLDCPIFNPYLTVQVFNAVAAVFHMLQ